MRNHLKKRLQLISEPTLLSFLAVIAKLNSQQCFILVLDVVCLSVCLQEIHIFGKWFLKDFSSHSEGPFH